MKAASPKTVCRLQIQGLGDYTPEQLASFRFGIRFAYLACVAIAAIGIWFVHIPTLFVLAVIAFGTVILPNHPFDYLYNYGVRHIIGRPPIPRRTPQTKFACGVATIWLLVTIYLFNAGSIVAGQIFGAGLVAVGGLVGLTDICIPSMIYNLMTKRKVNPFASKGN